MAIAWNCPSINAVSKIKSPASPKTLDIFGAFMSLSACINYSKGRHVENRQELVHSDRRRVRPFLGALLTLLLPYFMSADDEQVITSEDMELLSLFSPSELEGICCLVDALESIRPGFCSEGIKCGLCGYEIGWAYIIGYLGNPTSSSLRTELLVRCYGKSAAAIKDYSLEIANSLPIPCIKCWKHAWI